MKTLSLLLIVFASGLHAEFKYLQDQFPPDHDVLEAYQTGKTSELQQKLADAWVELATKWNKPEQDTEARDALRRALMYFPGHEAARNALAALPELPEQRKNYKLRNPDSKYLTAVQSLLHEQGDDLAAIALAFAKAGLPTAASFALQQACTGGEGDKRQLKKLEDTETAMLEALATQPLRVSSYNVLYAGGTDINDTDPAHWLWSKRRPLHDENLRMMQADVIGLQETTAWAELIEEHWGEVYAIYRMRDFTGDPKQGDSDVAILYNKLRFEIVEQGYRNLNRFNDIKNKKADWGAKNSRQASWLRLRDRASGLQFYFHDIHTAWAGESYKGDDGATGTTDDLHAHQMQPCVEEIEKACPLLPQIFVGDFNNRGGAPWRMLVEEGPFADGNSHRDKAFGIDWILGTPHLKLKWAGTVYAKEGDVRASDHLQVLAYYELPDLTPLRDAHEAAPEDGAATLAYARALVMTDPAAAAELLDEAIEDLDKGARDEHLWLFAQLQEYFLEPEDAVKTYRKLEKETEDEERKHAAIYRGFAVLVWRKLAKPRDVKQLKKYVDDKDTPPAWAEKARKLAEQAG